MVVTVSTRTALIEAATRLLDQGGAEAVTLREVGRLSGVSHNAPYKHFANKEALLAAVAAAELTRRRTSLAGRGKPENVLRKAMHGYVAWALEYPARFRLVFGPWSVHDDELAAAAQSAQSDLVDVVAAAQKTGALPAGDPERLASLVRAVAHGAADLAAAGHLAETGKGHASPQQLVDDLLGYLAS